jgi:hypothetical protein
MLEVENVTIKRAMRVKMRLINQLGLNPARLTPVLATSIKLDSQILSIIKDSPNWSSINPANGVDVVIRSTYIGAHSARRIRIAKLETAHLFFGRATNETLNRIIFNIG